MIDAGRWQALRASLAEDPGDPAETGGPAPPVLVDIARRYGPTAAQRVEAVDAALEAQNWTAAVTDLHLLRGGSATLGAVEVERLAGDAEDRVVAALAGGHAPQLDRGLPVRLAEACRRAAAELQALVHIR